MADATGPGWWEINQTRNNDAVLARRAAPSRERLDLDFATNAQLNSVASDLTASVNQGVAQVGPFRGLVEKFTVGDGKPSGIVRRPRNRYEVGRYIGDGLYDVARLGRGTNDAMHLADRFIGVGMRSVDQEEGTRDGSWGGGSSGTSQEGAYQGTYRSSDDDTTPGSISWTSPANTTAVGMRAPSLSNAGVHVVSIDGDKTAATLLPTAQDLVDEGSLAAGALTSGGGDLDPTWRCLDQWRDSDHAEQLPSGWTDWDRTWAFARNLAPGAHTVKVELSGYSGAGSSPRLYVGGFMWATADTDLSDDDAGFAFMTPVNQASGSAAEYAYELDFGSGMQWVGNSHGNETEQTFTITVDGTSVSLAAAEDKASGDSVVAVRTTTLTHPDHVGDVATVTTTYTVDDDGLTVEVSVAWSSSPDLGATYHGMMPVSTLLTAANLAGDDPDLTLTAADDSFYGNKPSRVAYLWNPDGQVAALALLLDLDGVNSWRDSVNFTRVQDRSDVNKTYFERTAVASGKSVSSGGQWTARFRYLAGWFPDADVFFARPAKKVPQDGARLWVPSPAFDQAAGGIPSRTPLNARAVSWQFADSVAAYVGTTVRLPDWWSTFDVVLYWANTGSGSGDVRWAATWGAPAVSGTVAGGTTVNTTSTAGAQNAVVSEQVLTGVAVDGAFMWLRIGRLGTDGADTLAESAALLGIDVVRAS